MANTVEVSSNIWNWINTSVQVPAAVREKKATYPMSVFVQMKSELYRIWNMGMQKAKEVDIIRDLDYNVS